MFEFGDLISVADVANWRATTASILLAYVLTQSIAWVYARTYSGLSYSRSMVQALAVAGIVSSMLMLAIGSSLARGIGIVGTLALIRFRTNLRDPLDMVYVFAAFGAGIAAGTGSFSVAIIGTVVFLGVIALLRTTSFGAHRQYDGVIRLRSKGSREEKTALLNVLEDLCERFVLITLREVSQGDEYEHVYQVSLIDPSAEEELVANLAGIDGIAGVSLAMQEATVEL